MKVIYTIIFICNAIHPMSCARRPVRPIPTRSYSSQNTIQIKITNPKLIASLEAARKKAEQTRQPTLPTTTRKSPAIIANFYLPNTPFPKIQPYTPQTRSSQAPRLSSNNYDIPADFQTRPEILTNAALAAIEGYAEYKIYKAVDNALFNQPHHCTIAPSARSNATDDDDDPDEE